MLAQKMQRSLNLDFWPSNSLEAWRLSPLDTFNSWLAEKRVAGRTLRRSTTETYTAVFSSWVQFLTSRKLGLLEATPIEVDCFFSQRNLEGPDAFARTIELEPTSRRRYLLLLNKVYTHLRTIGNAAPNPVIPAIKQERSLEIELPPGLADDALNRLIDLLADQGKQKGARDRALAALMIGAGLRASEIAACTPDWLYEGYSIRVAAGTVYKPHKTVILPDGPWRQWFSEWMDHRQKEGVQGCVVCPATPKGNPFTRSGLFRRVSQWLKGASIEAPQTGANLLRNTFAQLALTCGRYDAAQVQAYLGNELARTTARHVKAVQTTGRDLGVPSTAEQLLLSSPSPDRRAANLALRAGKARPCSQCPDIGASQL